MKILFICSETKQLGVSCLMSYLDQQGHKVALIVDPWLFDNEYIRINRLNRYFSDQRWSRYIAQIGKMAPELIGFSVNIANYKWALSKAEQIKKRFDIPVIFV